MNLAPGTVFGRICGTHQAGAFGIACLRPTVPMHEMAEHTHNDAHLVLVLSGSYQSAAYAKDDVSQGPALIFNPPGTEHRDCFTELSGSFMTVALPAEQMGQLLSGAPGGAPVHLPALLPQALALFRSLGRAALHTESLALDLFERCAGARPDAPAARQAPAWLKRAQDMIEDRHADLLGLESIADAVGVHPAHLTRSFRRFAGLTPGQFHALCRMERALGLLLRGSLPVAAVSAAAGYADQPHFARRFSRVYGMAPGAFRAILQA